MITRMVAGATLGALLTATLGPAPASADEGRAILVSVGAGVAAFGLTAALLGSHAPLVYPAPSVIYVPPAPPAHAAPPAQLTAPPPPDHR